VTDGNATLTAVVGAVPTLEQYLDTKVVAVETE